ncbi:MAG: hypothetical protein QG640_693 [Patescibacteria group bacterium]|nr:hypothetical protein [Patescibacteria group bacterium]
MTQGLISIVQDGKVVMKIITGADGQCASKVAKAIKKLGHIPEPEEAYDLALRHGFGHESSLVVMNGKETFHKTDTEGFEKGYRQTFDNPEFNPRWDHGTADYTQIVHL